MDAKIRKIETVYPPEFHEAVQPLYDMIEQARADLESATGISDKAMTALAMMDHSGREAKVEAYRHHVRLLQEQIVRIMARYNPTQTMYFEPAPSPLTPKQVD